MSFETPPPILNLLINLRQSVSGGDFTLQRGLSSGDPYYPFENVHAAVYQGFTIFPIQTAHSM